MYLSLLGIPSFEFSTSINVMTLKLKLGGFVNIFRTFNSCGLHYVFLIDLQVEVVVISVLNTHASERLMTRK